MPGATDPFELSELEREFEFEMDDSESQDSREMESDFEFAFEADDSASEYESADDREPEWELEAVGDSDTEHAERFFELSQREFESEAEADDAVNELLREMEPEYFFGGLKKAFTSVKRLGGRLANSPLGKLAKKGIAAAGGQLPMFQALKGITALARGDLRGLLAQLAKSGLGAAFPGAGPLMPVAMKAMGFEAGVAQQENSEAWNNFVTVSREAYEHLASNLNERADDPLEASRLANQAFQQALRNAPRGAGPRVRGAANRGGGRVVYIRPGEQLVIRVRRN